MLWETPIACRFVSSDGELLTLVGPNPEDPDGEERLLSIDAANGEVVTDNEIPDDLRALMAGQALVGTADDVAVFSSYDIAVSYDLDTQTELSSIVVDATSQRSGFDRSTLSIDGDAVWLFDRPGATVSRLDPQTGATLWTTPIPLTAEFDVAVSNDTAYVLTFQALIALDDTTGEMLWSEFRTPFN